MDKFTDRLTEALNLKGWSAADLSRASGVGKDSISRYIHGEIIPKRSKVSALARALSVSPAWLMGFDVAMDGTAQKTIDVEKLSEINRAKLEAYYQALLDSQGANNGNTQME